MIAAYQATNKGRSKCREQIQPIIASNCFRISSRHQHNRLNRPSEPHHAIELFCSVGITTLSHPSCTATLSLLRSVSKQITKVVAQVMYHSAAFVTDYSAVRVSPLDTSAAIWLLQQPRMMDDDQCVVVIGVIGKSIRSTLRKPVRAPLCPHQIRNYLTWDRTRIAEVGIQRLTAGARAEFYRTQANLHNNVTKILQVQNVIVICKFVPTSVSTNMLSFSASIIAFVCSTTLQPTLEQLYSH